MAIFGQTAMGALSIALAVMGGVASANAQTAGAQTWPQSAVKLIVPLPPGSGSDIAARVLAELLAERWQQPVIVENRQGADGIPAVTSFLAARDTHQLLFSFAGIVTINPVAYERLPYDPKDLVPLAPVVDNYFGVAASAELKAETLADLIKIAKTRPNALNWAASPGVPHYVMLALQKSAGIQMVRVPYREFGPAIQDLTEGRLQVAATAMPFLLPHHITGKAKLMFVTARQRSPQAPDVPTAADAGYPDLVFEGTVGIFGWRDLPSVVQEQISNDVQAITANPAFRARLAKIGSAARTGTAAEFVAAIEQQRAKIAALHQTNEKPAQ